MGNRARRQHPPETVEHSRVVHWVVEASQDLCGGLPPGIAAVGGTRDLVSGRYEFKTYEEYYT
jgi:hypothetical protein